MYKTTKNIPNRYKGLFYVSRSEYNKRALRIIALLTIGISIILILQNLFLPTVPETDIWHSIYFINFFIITGLGLFYLGLSFIQFTPLKQYAIDFIYILLLGQTLIFLTWIDLHYSWELSAFLISILLLSTVLWLDFVLFSIAITLMFISLVIGLNFVENAMYLSLDRLINLFVYFCISWFIMVSTNNIRIKDFISFNELDRTNVKLEESLDEKELILKEVHHRIKNNMNIISSLLALQSTTINIPEAVHVFQDATARIESMGILYDKLYRTESYEIVSIKGYLSQLIDEIVQLYPDRQNIVIEKHIDDFPIKTKTIFSLGIIINELVTNAMKYAFTGREDGLIQISAKKEDNHITLVFGDNGIGMSEIKYEEEKGFGMRLIDMLVTQIDGSCKIENTGGTKYTIEFCQ